eukprot:gnl/TRDRNA2_/TRDRNA2_166257_c0_seq1.p1 gnl/TRDRNA2_/TRDRNA2_166257_c0~~gnl/TRDRNA2_/TRDRNA2_166257_c0_seq1.p1  ORF type:complete len:414 (-),score=71.28 gnl/TRDRNA2_/TRDRNA2_166257_c0_seq1:74-1315(-)
MVICLALLLSWHIVATGQDVIEISPAEYYGEGDQKIFGSPALVNVTFPMVEKLLLRGRPFIVVDGARGLPMASWTCDFVKKEFPESRIRMEGGKSDVNTVPMSSNWTQEKKLFSGAKKFPDGAPKVRPFYWDIAKAYQDEKHRKWGKDPQAAVKKIVSASAVPYWLPEQKAVEMGHSSEMWFHPPGAGAPAHMDPHCRTTVSFCFSGKRRWRIMLPPPRPHPEGYFDGQIYGVRNPQRKGEWQPTFEFEAPAGSAVVVFPGMVHETNSIGEECSASISQTFAEPVAAAYYRAFWPRFALIHEDVGMCAYLVEAMAALGSGQRIKPAPANDARKAGEAFAAKVDANRNGVISEDEIKGVKKSSSDETSRTMAELVAFHDVDQDGRVTVQEVVDSWVMYATAQHRVKELKSRGEL